MSNFKEIVTKAVVGKGKKNFSDEHTLELSSVPSAILGCWIINHTFKGVKEKDSVRVTGSFDTNIWYSTEKNTKTEVATQNVSYDELIPITRLEDYDGEDEIIVRILKQPTCTNATIVDGKVNYNIEKTIAAELVGDAKIKVEIDSLDDDIESPVEEEINEQVNEDFLK